jgi:hypothetical protein
MAKIHAVGSGSYYVFLHTFLEALLALSSALVGFGAPFSEA